MFYSVIETTAVFTFPVFIILLVLAHDVITLGFGDKWSVSVPVFQVLMAVALIESIYYYNGSLMMAMGKPGWKLRLNLLNAIVNVIGFYIAVQYGIVYVAIAYTLRTYLLSPLPLYCVRKLIQIDFREYLGRLLLPLVLSAVFGLMLYMLRWIVLNNIGVTTSELALPISVIVFLCASAVMYFALIMKYRAKALDEVSTIISIFFEAAKCVNLKYVIDK